MLDSRDINLLRSDVAANCRIWLDLCKAQGLNPLVVSTVRDDEYQAYLYAQGRTRPGSIITNSAVPTFHWNKAGLAFDFCKNIKGQEYSDKNFFRQCAATAKKMGFFWGGDWTSLVDMPHLQWDGPKREYTGAMIRALKLPPAMPVYKKIIQEEDDMTQEKFDVMMDDWLSRRDGMPPGDWKADEFNRAVAAGITDGTRPKAFAARDEVAVMCVRAMGGGKQEMPGTNSQVWFVPKY